VSDAIRFSSVAVNCPDATKLARFYADITRGEVTFSHPAWATMIGPGGRIDFQTVDDYRRPPWPGPEGSANLHLDFLVDDLAATEARVLRAGATKFEKQPNSEHCLVFADPDGHPFCLTTIDEIG
jgi:catechol 2,3-dioxygenase-like lactoylglutathione lyase family enzyme